MPVFLLEAEQYAWEAWDTARFIAKQEAKSGCEEAVNEYFELGRFGYGPNNTGEK